PAPLWRQPVQIGPLAFDAAGQTVAMGVQRFDRVPELLVGTLAEPVRLPPDAAAGPVSPSRVQAERVTWRNDGRDLQGWLLLPPAGKVVRGLVTDVHGGPAAAWQPEHVGAQDVRGQLLERGLAVFLPNPRGSSGRGEAFKRLVVRDVGQGDFSDVMTGIDAVLTRLPAEAGRHLGLMGASYGGYLSMWANTRTDRFAAIVAGSGIANWVSYAGQNGINEWLRPYFGATVYEDAAPYRAASPIEAIRRAKSPTLLYVGERDIETPAAQSLEYWRALRALGVASTLMVYAGEGHAIQSAQNIADVNRRVVGWFDRYLLSEP
ncbi:MAG: S9 family peptidase, partial [Variovorax sp.]